VNGPFDGRIALAVEAVEQRRRAVVTEGEGAEGYGYYDETQMRLQFVGWEIDLDELATVATSVVAQTARRAEEADADPANVMGSLWVHGLRVGLMLAQHQAAGLHEEADP
jgi:hypothetical protein